MGKPAVIVQVPGASADSTENGDAAAAGSSADAALQGGDEKDVEIARLRAALAAATAIPAADLMVMEADGPNTRKYKAESKHRKYTSDELHALVMSGEVKLTDHHVLCSDGWYVNPAANKQANG